MNNGSTLLIGIQTFVFWTKGNKSID